MLALKHCRCQSIPIRLMTKTIYPVHAVVVFTHSSRKLSYMGECLVLTSTDSSRLLREDG